MSQAKVDQYKKEKANRKKTLAKQKIGRRVGKITALVVVVAAIGFGVYKGVDNYYDNLPANTYYVDLGALQDYTTALDEE